MSLTSTCPIGFEEGHIVGYTADASKLHVIYEFWNAQQGLLVFDGLIGMRDNSGIGVTVGSVAEVDNSEFLDTLIDRRFAHRPAELGWKHVQFFDLDDQPMFEVVSESSSFSHVLNSPR